MGIIWVMEIPLANQENKRFPFDVLSPDEMMAIRGIEYSRLPANFTLSPMVFAAGNDVYAAFERYVPHKQSEAKKRLTNYFKSIEGTTNGYDLEFIKKAKEPWLDVEKDQEFGLQFYEDAGELVRGKVHTGQRRSILLRNNLDGIPDNLSVVQIHCHPNEMTQSVGDVVGIVADVDSVPSRCIYKVVTASYMHVMFPTIETQRYGIDEVRALISERFGPLYDETLSATKDFYQAQDKLMKAVAGYFKLGYYSGTKGFVLPRVL